MVFCEIFPEIKRLFIILIPKKTPAAYLSMRYSVPEWLAEMWLRDYGFEMTAEMGQAMLDDQKTTVRVREQSEYGSGERSIASEGLNIEEGCMLPEALHLSGYDYLGNVGPFCRRTYNCPG